MRSVFCFVLGVFLVCLSSIVLENILNRSFNYLKIKVMMIQGSKWRDLININFFLERIIPSHEIVFLELNAFDNCTVLSDFFYSHRLWLISDKRYFQSPSKSTITIQCKIPSMRWDYLIIPIILKYLLLNGDHFLSDYLKISSDIWSINCCAKMWLEIIFRFCLDFINFVMFLRFKVSLPDFKQKIKVISKCVSMHTTTNKICVDEIRSE